jgi:hypothetical protein
MKIRNFFRYGMEPMYVGAPDGHNNKVMWARLFIVALTFSFSCVVGTLGYLLLVMK